MNHLVSPERLVDQLDDPDLVTLEVCFAPPGSPASTPGGHVRGAASIWWKDLCWHQTDRRFPTPEAMAARLGRLGVSEGSRLILVGDPFQFATYAFWVLTITGLDHLAGVLDGGLEGWREGGFPVAEQAASRAPSPRPSPGPPDLTVIVGRDEVLAGLDRPDRVLVDLRSDEEFRGERVAPPTALFDHGAERGGHIPGARHLLHDRLLDERGRFRPPDEIEDEFRGLGASGAEIITYCRLSHRASLGWFAATRVAGRRNVRVYDGSWTEWGSIVGYPIELP